MKSNLTQLGIFLFTLLSITAIEAQTANTLTITAPASVAGEYSTIVSDDFGEQLTADLSGTATFGNDNVDVVTDLCDSTMVDDLTGLIAFIDRGTCTFVEKALFAERSGAIAVIICNDEARANEGFPPLGGGDRGPEVSIPVLGITYDDCVTIRTEAEGGEVMLTLSYVEPVVGPCDPVEYGADVIWGANGEGSFDGGLNGWSVDKGTGLSLDDGGWYYDMEARIDRGAFGGTNTMMSPTACNGVMVFDSDFYDTAGEADGAAGTGFNDGVCISDAGNNIFCEGLLISPEIDLSASQAEGLEIVWTQAIRQFQSQFFILLSEDGGTTWKDSITINADLPANTGVENNTQRSLTICGYENTENFRFAFFYRSAFYYWAIDDVHIRSTPTQVDLRANPFFSTYPNLVTPSSQVDEAAFIIDVENLQSGTATNTTVDVEVINLTTLTTVYTDSQDYPDIGCSFLDENRVFPNKFMDDLEEGSYRITYTVNTDDDVDMSNNTQSWDFEIGGDTFRKVDRTQANLVGINAPNQAYYSIGQFYHVPNGAGFKATSCRFGFAAPAGTFNAIINFTLHRWVDLNGNFQCEGGERILVGQQRKIVSNSQPEDFSNLFITLEDPNDPDAEIELEDDANYLLLANYSPISSTADPLGTLAVAQADLRYYYGATALAFQNQFQEIRGSGYYFATGIEGDEDDRTLGPAGNFTVYMPLTIKPLGATDTEDLADDQSIQIFPNPVSEKLYVDMNLGNDATDVNLELVNIQGQVILNKKYSNSAGNLTLDVAGLPAGFYSLNIRTENGLTSKKVIIEN